jgi:Uma2 family endonuclease
VNTAEVSERIERSTMPPINADCAGLRMTPEEFDAIDEYDELFHYELVDGVFTVNQIPLEGQAGPNEYLGGLLFIYKHQHPEGAVLDETLPERYVHLPNSRRLCDRLIWCGLGRRPDTRRDVPQIAVEFVSAGRRNWIRDYETKRDEYTAAGVREYWIVDRFARTMTVWTTGEDGPQERLLQEADAYTTQLLPGFELPLARLLAEADKWDN